MRKLSYINISLSIILAIVTGLIGYRLGAVKLNKASQTSVFPISNLKMSYIREILEKNNVKLTHYVPALITGEMSKELIEINSSNHNSDELVSVFVVDGYLPEKQKLNMIYISPKLTTNELKGLIYASNRR